MACAQLGPWLRKRQTALLIALTVLLFVFAIVAVVIVAVRPAEPIVVPKADITKEVKASAIVEHLKALQAIAEEYLNPAGVPSRSIMNGYNASAEYVAQKLTAVGYTVTRDYFDVPVSEELSPPTLSMIHPLFGEINFQNGTAFRGVRYGGDTDGRSVRTGPVVASAGAPTFGCARGDWPGEGELPLENKIAMFIAGAGCADVDKALLAESLGAIGIIVRAAPGTTVLPNPRLRVAVWLPDSVLVTVPTLAVTSTAGDLLAGSTTATLTVDIRNVMATTYNVYADLPGGDAENVIGVGAHLDSVPEGPGLVDNGSGSASILELALQYKMLGLTTANRLRFMWWGAEEIGLLGSYHYCRRNASELDAFAAYLNFDMVASPNWVLYVHNGTQSNANNMTQRASAVIQDMFTKSLVDAGQHVIYYPMFGGTDFVPFNLAGIAANGLFTGAGGIKSIRERTLFRGWANAAHDPCYHQPCDNIDNISEPALTVMAASMVQVVEQMASDRDIRSTLGIAGQPRIPRSSAESFDENFESHSHMLM